MQLIFVMVAHHRSNDARFAIYCLLLNSTYLKLIKILIPNLNQTSDSKKTNNTKKTKKTKMTKRVKKDKKDAALPLKESNCYGSVSFDITSGTRNL